MFGMLKKKLGDIVKKFSKEEDQEISLKEETVASKIPEAEIPPAAEEKHPEPLPEPAKEQPETPAIEEPLKEEAPAAEKAPETQIAEVINTEPQSVQGEDEPYEIEKKIELDMLETEKELIRLGVEEGSAEEIEKIEKSITSPESHVEAEKQCEPGIPEIGKESEERQEIPSTPSVEKHMPEEMKPVVEKPGPEEVRLPEKSAAPEPTEPRKVGFLGKIFRKKEKAPEQLPAASEDVQAAPVETVTEKAATKSGILGIITEKEISRDEASRFSEDLKIAMLESDVALEVAEKICEKLEKDMTGRKIRRGETESVIKESLRSAIVQVLDQGSVDIEEVIRKASSEKRPATIVFLGFNGTGKTTSLAKVAHMLKQGGFRPILAAGDTFRAASIEQLEIHARNVGTDIIKQKYGSDSAAIIFDAREKARTGGFDVVLADTAGRSHNNVNLMDELRKVIRVNKPDLKILVLDALTGNDIVEQAKRFEEAVGVDAIILSKADVYEKGGAALSASYAVGKPIIFLGTGQGYENLKKFDPVEIAGNLIG